MSTKAAKGTSFHVPLHWKDTELDSLVTNMSTSAASSSVTLVNGVAGGTSVNQRVGSNYVVKSIRIDLTFRGQAQVVAAPPLNMQWCVVLDKLPRDADPTIAEIFAAMPTASATNVSPYSHFVPLLTNDDRFKILKTGNVLFTATVANQAQELYQSYYAPLELKVHDAGTSGTIGASGIRSNAIFLILYWPQLVNQTGDIKMHGRVRIRFQDV